ncbi:MAG: hypothetical protein ACRDN1_12485 [Trebonia sp.]
MAAGAGRLARGLSIADLSHHMSDTFIKGPGATRLLAAVSANNYENFAVGQAKQFVPVAADGNIVTDGILLRTGEREYILSGVSAAQEWVKYGYRKYLGLYSFEGQNPLYGSFFSDSIEDYYVSPYELGYGRSISFGHDFIGRDALLKAKDTVRRTKVTLVFDPADAALAIAPGLARPRQRGLVPGGHRQPVRGARHRGDRELGRAPRTRHCPGRGPELPAHPRHRGARALQRARPHQLPGGRLTRGRAVPPEPMPALACWPPSQASAGMAVANPGPVTSARPYR